MATEARPRAPTISADIAILFIEDPSTLFERPADNRKNRQMFLLITAEMGNRPSPSGLS
ncbi:hypothetical protein [Bradyrhizobium sp. NAS96.2]|uniref:hypothetical protein n=1 Tax=Bradyrhizobium sp. NAS96.2 TaxID=1680160 RepID=UPI00143D4FD5|nr:hypothetical protein [Bradyrhizobium sp. NAS96.2]